MYYLLILILKSRLLLFIVHWTEISTESVKRNNYVIWVWDVHWHFSCHLMCTFMGVWWHNYICTLQESTKFPILLYIAFRKNHPAAGCTSGSRALCCNSLDPPAWWIDPIWQMHLQFGLFSVPTSGPQLVHQRLWYVSVRKCIWEIPCCLSERVAYVVTAVFP